MAGVVIKNIVTEMVWVEEMLLTMGLEQGGDTQGSEEETLGSS